MKENKSPKSYPIIKDKIDEYLWKEHHILGGCCSSTESVKYAVAREVAEKLTDAFIEKACDFLSKSSNYNEGFIYPSHSGVIDAFVNNFKNYMKGE